VIRRAAIQRSGVGNVGDLIKFLLGSELGLLITRADVTTGPHGAQKGIPKSEEGLAEVGLDAPALVVDIVVCRIVGGNFLQWVKRKSVSAVIVDSLDGAASEEPHGLAASHAREKIGEASAESVEQETLEWVVVQGSVGIGNV